MTITTSTSGHICLCELYGAITAASLVSLLAQLKQCSEGLTGGVVLILGLHPTSAESIIARPGTLMDVLPALWAHCQEILIACSGRPEILDQLRRLFCGSASAAAAALAHPVAVFDDLDQALVHVQRVFPYDALALRRQRIRAKNWDVFEMGRQPEFLRSVCGSCTGNKRQRKR